MLPLYDSELDTQAYNSTVSLHKNQILSDLLIETLQYFNR